MSVIHAPRQPTIDGRVLIFPIGIALSLLVIFLRLWYLQVVRAAELSERAEYYRNTAVAKLAPRGLIFDRNGALLAGVQARIVVTAKPKLVEQNPWVLDKVAGLLGVEVRKLREKVNAASFRPYLPATIFVGAPIDVATKIAESSDDLPGIGVESQPMRYYPDSKSFAHVLGYVWVPNEKDAARLDEMGLRAADYVGKTGIEYIYEKELMGAPGAERMEVDAKRRPLRVVGRDSPTPGRRLVLSLDASLQKLALQLLAGREGAVVALDPQTGEVLCLASSPSYDASLFQNGISSADWEMLNKDERIPLLNRAIYSSFAPGSTFKIVTAIAAARAGRFDPRYRAFCAGYYQIGRRKLKCMGRHGSISFHEAMTRSCNAYFADMGVRAGEDHLRAAALEVGLNQRSGIDLRSEGKGLVPTDEWIRTHRNPPKWYGGDTANLSIGQGELSTTPLQMADVAALVAMEGKSYRPHLVRAITDENGQRTVVPEVARSIEASSQFWAELKASLVSVVERGTAQSAKAPGIVIGGKTGSAEHRGKAKTHGWFVGFAPAQNPQIAICVLVEAGGHGGEVAAPIAGQIIRTYLGRKSASTPSKNLASASAASASASRSSLR